MDVLTKPSLPRSVVMRHTIRQKLTPEFHDLALRESVEGSGVGRRPYRAEVIGLEDQRGLPSSSTVALYRVPSGSSRVLLTNIAGDKANWPSGHTVP